MPHLGLMAAALPLSLPITPFLAATSLNPVNASNLTSSQAGIAEISLERRNDLTASKDKDYPDKDDHDTTLMCYNKGISATIDAMNYAIDDFCTYYRDQVITSSVHRKVRGACNWLYCGNVIDMSIELDPGCEITIDGPEPIHQCYFQFTRVAQNCDTNTMRRKQGGASRSSCATWTIDPNWK